MQEIKVKDILKITNSEIICGNTKEILGNVKKDTREIDEGDTYIGLNGENFNRK